MKKNIFKQKIKDTILMSPEMKSKLLNLDEIPDETYLLLENFFEKFKSIEQRATEIISQNITSILIGYIKSLEDIQRANEESDLLNIDDKLKLV